MSFVVDLHHQTFIAREAIYKEMFGVHRQAWEQFQRLQIYQENGIKQLAVEQAELCGRAAAMEVASCIRQQERHIQLKVTCSNNILANKLF